MKTPPTNLQVLKKSRRKPEVGDIFAFQIDPLLDRYFFGRVIDLHTNIGNCEDVILIYLYKATSSEKDNIPKLSKEELLVPPIGTNDRAWIRGFFETVRTGENGVEDILSQHCFRDSRGWFLDEKGNRLPAAVEPFGVYGLSGIGAIDIDISQALGIPLKEQG